MREYPRRSTVKKVIRNFSIVQNISIATLGIVTIALAVTSIIYYSIFSVQTDTLVESQSKEINKQIVLNYESYINSIIETAIYVQAASLSHDAVQSYEELQMIFQLNSEIKTDIVAIFLFDKLGNKLVGDEISGLSRSEIRLQPWFRTALNDTEIYHFSAAHNKSLSEVKDEQVISVSKSVDYLSEGLIESGLVLIELNFKKITDITNTANLGKDGHILIIDDNDALIFSSAKGRQNNSSESFNIAVSNYFGSFKAVIDSVSMYMNINTLNHTRWRIVTVNNIDDIAKAKNSILLILFIIFLLSFITTTVVAFLISRRISKPLSKLKKIMLKIEEGDFTTNLTISGQKEIVQLSTSFNSMIEKIRSLMKTLVEEQREKRKTELRALQNQINPHFLYNTLDSIVWLAENDRTDDVITTVVALARFFRISISKGANFIPVADEVEHIRNYLTIQRIRYVNKFEYTFDIEEKINNYSVMKLILQPMVENAIYHGVGDEKEKISIRGFEENGFLIFEVENTGYGITEDRIKEIHTMLRDPALNKGIGIKNVYQRLKLYYGERADIIITSELDEMTNVRLIIPLENQQGESKG